MTWRDRDGELYDNEPEWLAGPPPHPADCDGWIGEDDGGRPIPCARCHPHLTDRATRGGP